jgi:hypothetical protein
VGVVRKIMEFYYRKGERDYRFGLLPVRTEVPHEGKQEEFLF